MNVLIDDMEPVFARLIADRTAARQMPPYTARATGDVAQALTQFFAQHAEGSQVEDVRRMGGGASKEQFVFTLLDPQGQRQHYVLRMDPREAITATDRRREYEVLNAVQALMPAPRPVWIDDTGACFGQPAVIMEFVAGVTKPSGQGVKATGVGTYLGEPLRSQLRGPFLDYLVRLHALDWRQATLPSFAAPEADPKQAARWSLNYWRAMLALDKVEDRPVVALAEQWLLDHLPDTDELVLVHNDYRTGNYLFDETAGRITAVLDWELARIGDFHEDLAYSLMQVFAVPDEDGVVRTGDLYTREAFIEAYEKASGRTVNRRTLHYYDVLSVYKCYIVVAASGLSAARAKHNHQDVLLSYVGAITPLMVGELCRLLSLSESA